jgi:hypothetical protein
MFLHRSLAVFLLALLSGLAVAAEEVVVVTDMVEAQATVVGIDKAQRRIVLRDAQAREYDITAGPEVRNFNQIHQGDLIEVRFQRAAASRLEKASNPDFSAEVTETQRAPVGAKPAVTTTRSRAITAKVLEVDTRHRLLTVQGPKGNVVTVRVPPTLLAFDQLQVGDYITAGYTEAVAISVRTPARKK